MPSYLVKSMRMSAFPLCTSVKVSGVTSLQIFSASRNTRRTFSSPICQGNRTMLQENNAGIKYTYTGCIVAGRDYQHCVISAVILSAGRWAVSDALRLTNKTVHHSLFFSSSLFPHIAFLAEKIDAKLIFNQSVQRDRM